MLLWIFTAIAAYITWSLNLFNLRGSGKKPAQRDRALSSMGAFFHALNDNHTAPHIHSISVHDTPVDKKQLIAAYEKCFGSFDRFRSTIHEIEGTVVWSEPNMNMDFSKQFHEVTLPGKDPEKEMQDYISEQMSRGFDQALPQWEVHIMNYKGHQRCDTLSRINHCIGDGSTLTNLFGKGVKLLEPLPVRKRGKMPKPTLPQIAMYFLRKAYVGVLTIPNVFRTAILPDTYTCIKANPDRIGKKKFFRTTTLPLSEVKELKNIIGATVNDVLTSMVMGGLRRYWTVKGDPIVNKSSSNLTANMIMDMRPLAQKLDPSKVVYGNKFATVPFSMNCNKMSALERIAEAHKTLSFVKESPTADLTYAAVNFGHAHLSPSAVRTLADTIQANTTIGLSNVAGLPVPVSFGGEKITRMANCTLPFSLGMTVHLLSYNGLVTCSIATDANCIPDPDLMLKCFLEEWAAIKEESAELAASRK